MAQPAAGAVAAPITRTLDGAPDPRLRRVVLVILLLITAGFTYLDYWNYSRSWHDGGTDWLDLLAGRGFAPAQYRIGVLRLAAFLAHLTHTGLRHMFALIDCVSLAISLPLLFRFLNEDGVRVASREASDSLVRWLEVSLGFGLVVLSLMWCFWYQKPETQPTLLLLALSAWALRGSRPALAAPAQVLLAAIGATVRADAIVAFHLGCLLVCLLPSRQATGRASLPLGRLVQAVTSTLSLLAAVAVQYWIMHRLYPHAPKQVASLQLLHNLVWPEGYVAVVLALFPWWLTLRLAAARWRALDGWSLGLVAASVAHFAMFFTLGTAVEVRVFLPYALLLVPVSARLIADSLARSPIAP